MPDQDPVTTTDPRLDPSSPLYDADHAAEVAAGNVSPAPPSEPQAPAEDAEGGESTPDVVSRLRAGYQAGQGERRKTIEISPARYDGLAALFKPIDWDYRRKLIRAVNRKGEKGYSVDLAVNSACMADACVSMMIRLEPGADYVQLHTTVDKYRSGEPICFDTRLADILGIEMIGGESEADICRLVFGDPGIFDAHYMTLNGWSLDAFDIGGEDDEEEDEGGDRPT